MIDIVLDAARIEGAAKDVDVIGLKVRAFTAILDIEAKHLTQCGELIEQLRREIAVLAA